MAPSESGPVRQQYPCKVNRFGPPLRPILGDAQPTLVRFGHKCSRARSKLGPVEVGFDQLGVVSDQLWPMSTKTTLTAARGGASERTTLTMRSLARVTGGVVGNGPEHRRASTDRARSPLHPFRRAETPESGSSNMEPGATSSSRCAQQLPLLMRCRPRSLYVKNSRVHLLGEPVLALVGFDRNRQDISAEFVRSGSNLATTRPFVVRSRPNLDDVDPIWAR